MADLNSIGGIHYEMMRRCYNKKSIAYKDYGAKGIKVCEEWRDREVFRKWCKENGWNKNLRLNRIDGTKDYLKISDFHAHNLQITCQMRFKVIFGIWAYCDRVHSGRTQTAIQHKVITMHLKPI